MNGVHDMGGMEGLGPVERENDEPLFHAPWEARMMAVNIAMGAWKKWNIDHSRHAREKIPGPTYLSTSYYEKWLLALGAQMVETGLVTREELVSGRPDPQAPKATPPLRAEQVAPALARGGPVIREMSEAPVFKTGDTVRARNMHPHGHTRLPRYARGKMGVIHRHQGAHVFPDTNAHFQGEQPRHLYSVRFEATELWGDSAGGRDAVYIDLWEPYLEGI